MGFFKLHWQQLIDHFFIPLKNKGEEESLEVDEMVQQVDGEYTLWYQKATYTNIFLKKTQNRVKFETTVETNNKSISRQTTMDFVYLHETILIR